MDNNTFLWAECTARERQDRLSRAAAHALLYAALPAEPGARARLARWFLALAVRLDPQLPTIAPGGVALGRAGRG